MKISLHACCVLFFSLLVLFACRKKQDSNLPVEVDMKPVGLTQSEFESLQNALLVAPAFKEHFGNDQFRMLSFKLDDDFDDKPQDSKEDPSFAQQLNAEFYNYTQQQAIKVGGRVRGALPTDLSFQVLDYQPRPSLSEYRAVENLVTKQLHLTKWIENDSVTLFPAMPSVIQSDEGHRIILIGVRSQIEKVPSGVFGMNTHTGELTNNLFDTLYHLDDQDDNCELPSDENCPSNGSSGTVHITISQGGTTLWTFRAVRPSASSGHPGKGSGVELRYVRYKGKLVLWRAHLPILNVHYDGGVCGPYRDWQDQETCFDCTGTDVGSTGFRLCNAPAKTLVDDQTDAGNFSGVAVHVEGTKVVLTSELKAGWYRYISEWTFHTNGKLSPRFKFAGVRNRCTCKLHFHHAYWRFDFDILSPPNNSVEEWRKSGNQWSKVKAFTKEEKRFRSGTKKWRIRNRNKCYDIIPGHHDTDGTGDSWAKGDVWVVRYHGNELEDGVGCILCQGTTGTIQDQVFLTGENVDKKDVVIWYRASYNHNDPPYSTRPTC